MTDHDRISLEVWEKIEAGIEKALTPIDKRLVEVETKQKKCYPEAQKFLCGFNHVTSAIFKWVMGALASISIFGIYQILRIILKPEVWELLNKLKALPS